MNKKVFQMSDHWNLIYQSNSFYWSHTDSFAKCKFVHCTPTDELRKKAIFIIKSVKG